MRVWPIAAICSIMRLTSAPVVGRTLKTNWPGWVRIGPEPAMPAIRGMRYSLATGSIALQLLEPQQLNNATALSLASCLALSAAFCELNPSSSTLSTMRLPCIPPALLTEST